MTHSINEEIILFTISENLNANTFIVKFIINAHSWMPSGRIWTSRDSKCKSWISGNRRRRGNAARRDRSLFRGWTFLIRPLKVRKNVESEVETLLVVLGFERGWMAKKAIDILSNGD